MVIGLQSTGESRTLEHLERHNGRLSSFVSTSKMIIQSFVEKHFPAPKRDSFHRLLNTGEFEPEPRFRPPRPKKAKMSSDWFDDDMDAEAGESDIEMYESSLSVDDDRAKTGRKRRGRPPKAEKGELRRENYALGSSAQSDFASMSNLLCNRAELVDAFPIQHVVSEGFRHT